MTPEEVEAALIRDGMGWEKFRWLDNYCRSPIINLGQRPPGSYTVRVTAGLDFRILNAVLLDSVALPISQSCEPGTCNTVESATTMYRWDLCKQVSGHMRDECDACFKQGGVWTAVGCIARDPIDLIQTLIKIGLSIGGGIALLIILAGAFTLTVSQGDPKKTSEAKEMITSAIIGLIFIIFSVAILQFIGVQILRIPEFGT
jgi:hypothetical protein